MGVQWLICVISFLLCWEGNATFCNPVAQRPGHLVCDDGRQYRSAFRVLADEHEKDPGAALTNASNGTVTCQRHAAHIVECDGVEYENEERLTPDNPTYWTYVIICLTLTCTAGLMSGLQLGLLALDYNTLLVLMNAGEPHEQIHARKIEPLVKRRHLLLVTLLITNAACLEALPLFLDKLLSPFATIVVSVTAVLFFGEIVPQSVCVRYGLAIGAFMSPVVWMVIGITFPLSWPLSKLLDAILGQGEATFFRRGELKELVLLQQQQGFGEEKLTEDETNIIRGALEMTTKGVQDRMTPIDKVFMLDMDGVLDLATMKQIQDHGHSRIPIYHKTRNSIVGMILVKDLLLLDPEDCTPIESINIRKMPTVGTRKPLYEMLNLFQTGSSHLAEVVDSDDCMTLVGIVTLEDVIEELIGEEIIDETDEKQKSEVVDKYRTTRLGRLTAAKKAKEVPSSMSDMPPVNRSFSVKEPGPRLQRSLSQSLSSHGAAHRSRSTGDTHASGSEKDHVSLLSAMS
eukprot:CAMPEP_0174333642 /NCGR_PEP_ID=MMETSP0810-20121108/19317_1 /TAXON_ID=73025 ORGANISM="Eutreptiella gymnastica-like, Strain CCMP1594" /NCGR_SAMPLE_ID=MMETSP0810 /ASSEMBLY_ACC=CAM_ASM_000659 /LENGTH=514 /DNA_ID=CAMNT_0015450885 /DNA_START=20 /DNA_END=1561 /DNA_ORIENTATION=+